jgi:hypothetical protein
MEIFKLLHKRNGVHGIIKFYGFLPSNYGYKT